MKEKKQVKIDPGTGAGAGKQHIEELYAKKQQKNGKAAAEDNKHCNKHNSGSHKGLPAAESENEQQDCLGEPGENNYYILGRDDYNYVDDERD